MSTAARSTDFTCLQPPQPAFNAVPIAGDQSCVGASHSVPDMQDEAAASIDTLMRSARSKGK
jgi:hypothetical protein